MKTFLMKYQLTLVVGIFALLTLTLIRCSSGKYYSDFKSRKKSVEKLAVIKPFIYVKSVKDQKESEDNELSNKLEKQISAKTNSILSGKYILIDISNTSDIISEKDLQALFSKLDNSETRLSSVKIPPFIQKDFTNIKERYCLKIFFQGYYNGYLKPNEDVKQALQSNVVYLNFRRLFRSDIRLVIFDILENDIVYYDKKVSNDIDPRLPMAIEQMTSNILRPVYYK